MSAVMSNPFVVIFGSLAWAWLGCKALDRANRR